MPNDNEKTPPEATTDTGTDTGTDTSTREETEQQALFYTGQSPVSVVRRNAWTQKSPPSVTRERPKRQESTYSIARRERKNKILDQEEKDSIILFPDVIDLIAQRTPSDKTIELMDTYLTSIEVECQRSNMDTQLRQQRIQKYKDAFLYTASNMEMPLTKTIIYLLESGANPSKSFKESGQNAIHNLKTYTNAADSANLLLYAISKQNEVGKKDLSNIKLAITIGGNPDKEFELKEAKLKASDNKDFKKLFIKAKLTLAKLNTNQDGTSMIDGKIEFTNGLLNSRSKLNKITYPYIPSFQT
jgi:hypothetical protein